MKEKVDNNKMILNCLNLQLEVQFQTLIYKIINSIILHNYIKIVKLT